MSEAIPTRKVLHKETKSVMRINQSDFNPTIHEPYRPKVTKSKATGETKKEKTE